MHFSRACITTVAIIGLFVAGGVAAPAQAAPAAASQAVEEVSDPDVDSTIWSPPDDAVGGEVPESNPPAEDWAPAEDAVTEDGEAGDAKQPPAEGDVEPDAQQRSVPDADSELVTPMAAPVGTNPGKPGLGELPWFAFQDFELWEQSTARVNLGNGNLLVKANDSKIAVPGFALRQDRFYNGLATTGGSLGGGWQSNNAAGDVGVIDDGNGVDYYAVNGAKFRFTASGSNYTAPNGSNLTLKKDTNSTTARYIVESNKTAEKWKFSTNGWLTSTTDRNDVGETYAYSGNRISTVTHANGRKYTFTYTSDSSGLYVNVTDSAGRVTQYLLVNGRLSAVWDLVGTAKRTRTDYTYDSTGRLASILYPWVTSQQNNVFFEYDSSHRVTKVREQFSGATGNTNPSLYRETTVAYNVGETVVTDPNGNTAKYKIDGEGRVTETYDGLNRKRTQSWTANSDIQSTTDAQAQGNQTVYTYDGNNNETRAQLPTGAAASAAYAVGANCSAPNTGTAFQPKCSTDAAGNSKQYQYDASGNLTKQTNVTGGNAQTEFEKTYDNSGRSVCGGFAGQVCTTKDGNGKTTSYTYDTAGNMTKVTPPAPMGATTYAYDSLGRVTSTTDGNSQTVAYSYDVHDHIAKQDYPTSADITYLYSEAGWRTREAAGSGTSSSTQYTYDKIGRLTRQSLGTVNQQYTYDKTGNILTFGDDFGVTTYTYDAANQLTTVRENGGTCPTTGNPAASSGCTLLQYDNNGKETKRIYPGGAVVETARDNSGRATRITGKAATGSNAVDVGYSYAFPGTNVDQSNLQVRTAHLEEGITGGAATTYSYDARNRLTKAEEKSGSNVTASWAYSYDGASNRTKQIRSGSTGAAAGTIDYTYNDANQLTSATGQSTTWTYDGAGQLTRKGLGGQTIAYNDRLQATTIGATAQTYVGAGNTNRLTSGSTTFENGALGLINAGGTLFTRTPDGSAIGSRGGASSYFVTDHLGSVIGMFNASGSYLGGYSYSPYGETRATSTNTLVTANIVRYTGGELDSSGLYKLGARYYDPTLGRFTQPDPSGQENNTYAYASCNPTNSADPSGLVSCQGGVNRTIASTVLVVVGVFGLLASGGAAAPLVAGVIGAGLTSYGIARTAYFGAKTVQSCRRS